MSPNEVTEPAEAKYDAIIVGAGFAGLYMLHRLRERGLRAIVFEAGSDVGGTWFWNRYPGARCDVESVDYSYSFSEELEQEWTWSERYATQPEILRYIHYVADKFGLHEDVRTNTRVVSAHYDESTDSWSVMTDMGERYESRYCIMATGNLSVPRKPQVDGIDNFQGEIYHTGSWPHEPVELAGKKVAVVGTGSSGTQLIPIAAQEAEQLTVFLRTPNFTVPANNGPLSPAYIAEVKANYGERREITRSTATGLATDMNRVSALAVSDEEREQVYEDNYNTAGFGFILSFNDLLADPKANQTAVDFLHSKAYDLIDDPAIAEKLTATDYPFGSKRPCVDTNFFETFNRPNVSLVDVKEDPIVALAPTGIQTTASTFDFDVVIFATGFDAMTGALNRIDIRGRGGESLIDRWSDGPTTYLGLGVSGFPNFFIVAGPGSPSVLSNMIVSIEQHVDFIDNLLRYVDERGVSEVEPELAAEQKWTEHVEELAYRTLYPVGNSWYLGPEPGDGRRRSFMPYVGGLRAFRRKCAAVAESGYEGFTLSGAAAQAATRPRAVAR